LLKKGGWVKIREGWLDWIGVLLFTAMILLAAIFLAIYP
jgi:hypothetical protein